MGDIGDRIRTRFLPALLTASGVTLLAAGLLSYTQPVAAEPAVTAPPTVAASATPVPTPSPLITLPPLGSAAPPSATPSADPDRVATRVRIAALDIDMPVVKHTTTSVPCNVALFPELAQFGPPGFGRATYIYAHARTGMFLPLLERSKVMDGRGMLGMVVEVWTSDEYRFLYEIVEVRRHVRPETGYDDPFAATREELWLQTSEGPGVPAGQPRNPLLQVVALPLSVERADPPDAHPKAEPLTC